MNLDINFETLKFLIALPLFIVGYCVKESIDYFKKNQSQFKEIEDYINKENFNKLFLPLFENVNDYLVEEITRTKDQEVVETIKKYELEKSEFLSNTDISTLGISIRLQDIISSHEKNSQSKKDFNILKTRIRDCLIYSTVLSCISIIALGLTFFSDNIIFKYNSIIVGLTYIAGMVCIMFYWYYLKLKLDRYGENSK